MTFEEYKKLTYDEQEELLSDLAEEEDEEGIDGVSRLLEQFLKEIYSEGDKNVYETDGVYFIINDGFINEISDDAGYNPRGSWFPDVFRGLSEETRGEVEEIITAIGADEEHLERLADEVLDDPDYYSKDSNLIESYEEMLDDADEEEAGRLSEDVELLKALSVELGKHEDGYRSMVAFFDDFTKRDLEEDTVYFYWEGEILNLYYSICDTGEIAGEFDNLNDYDWLQVLLHLDDHKVL